MPLEKIKKGTARDSAVKLVTEFLQSPGTNKELEAKFGEDNLCSAVGNILGWSVCQLVKNEKEPPAARISLTDLQTDLRDMIDEICRSFSNKSIL
jgi:hypothetical protein